MLFLLAAAGGSWADDAQIRQAIEGRFGVKVGGVQPTPIPGLFEVQVQSDDGPQIIYSDAQGNSIVVNGQLLDVKSKRNITQERLQKLSAIPFDSLPLDLAVKVQRGSGKRVLVMFSDPYCPYCKEFEKTLQQIDDITIYVFMYPVIRPELSEHSKAVWCSPDRSKAWLDLALRGRQPAASATCDAPIAKLLELGGKLRVRSTPTLFLANGERLSGGMSVDRLRATLDDPAHAAKAK
jgi:thiol:disulfide interchange protein DsbC